MGETFLSFFFLLVIRLFKVFPEIVIRIASNGVLKCEYKRVIDMHRVFLDEDVHDNKPCGG